MSIEAAKQLLIVGASVRAAAQSAVRAGYTVWGADLFADADLCAIADARAISRYPSGVLAELATAPQAPWIYTGALENYPALLERMARLRKCWGNSAEVVRRVRDPLQLASVLLPLGVAFPATYKAEEGMHLPADTTARWLLKPKRSGGGSKVAWFDEPRSTQASGRTFVQQYIPGVACSAVYVAAGGRAVLLGMSRQLLGTEWLGAEGFAYCGSVGGIELTERQRTQLKHIGDVLAREFGLLGLLGVDLVQRATEQAGAGEHEFVVIEVNPRYTASVEVLERSLNFAAIRWHVEACELGELPAVSALPAISAEHVLAKGILFARQDTTFRAAVAEYVREQNREPFQPMIADVPQIDTTIACGFPVVTLFASGSSEAEAEDELRRVVNEFEAMLYN